MFYIDLSLGFVNTLSDFWFCHTRGKWQLLNPEHLVMLLTGSVSHISIQCMEYIEIFNIPLDLSTIYLLVLVGVELPLSMVVTPS